MAATVVLLHRLPNGSEHLDWLLQRPAGGPLIAFRLHVRPDRPPPWRTMAQRLPDHREAYLTYQGEVSGGRGIVSRVASGECRVLSEAPGVLAAALSLGTPADLHARLLDNGVWELELRPATRGSTHPPSRPGR